MLSEQTQTTIKSTLPLLHAQGEAIAARTYEILFDKYPQTNILFTKAPPNQPQLLAKAIIHYCEYIDDLSALDQLLDNIAAKHLKMDVHPGHYPMLGHSWLQAVQEVMGDDFTEEMLSAWKDAYFFLADLLIERERELATQGAQSE